MEVQRKGRTGLGAQLTFGCGLQPNRQLHADALDRHHSVQRWLSEHERQLLRGFHPSNGRLVVSRRHYAEGEEDLGSTFLRSEVQLDLL